MDQFLTLQHIYIYISLSLSFRSILSKGCTQVKQNISLFLWAPLHMISWWCPTPLTVPHLQCRHASVEIPWHQPAYYSPPCSATAWKAALPKYSLQKSCICLAHVILQNLLTTNHHLGTIWRPPSYRRHLHQTSGERGGPSPELWWMSGSLSWIWRRGFAKVRQTLPCFAKVRMKARTYFWYTLEFAWITKIFIIPRRWFWQCWNDFAALGIKMTGVSKTSLLIFVVFARFIVLTAKFWQVCAQQCHKETDNILNTTTKCGCYVTGACVTRSVRNKTDTREVFDHLWALEGSFEHES